MRSRNLFRLWSLLIVWFSTLPYTVAQNYTVKDLGALRGGSAVPRSLNLFGVVVGRSGRPHGEGTGAFAWDSGHGIRALGSLSGGDYSAAFAINNAGQVAGYSNTSNHLLGFVWTVASGLRPLPPLAGDDSSQAFAINSAGQIAGNSSGSRGISAIVWTSGTPRDLGTLPGDSSSEAYGINDSGEIVGKSSRKAIDHAFLSSNGAMTDLGLLPNQTSAVAQFINNAGQVVGSSSGPEGTLAFIWDKSNGMQNLGTLPGGDYSQANALNSAGIVVGASGSVLSTRAFIWDAANGMQDLNGLIPQNAGVILAGASAINDRGQIVAYGGVAHDLSHDRVVQLDHEGHAGPLHVFLLTPVGVGSKP
jgi:probable HAF family extracellular repeat protein